MCSEVYVDGWEEREDCTVVDVPSECIGYVTGARRAALGNMEEEGQEHRALSISRCVYI